MILNPDVVDVYTSLKKTKTPKTQEKQPPTESRKNAECQLKGPSFYI